MLANLLNSYNYLINVFINILYRFDISNGWLFLDVSSLTQRVVHDGLFNRAKSFINYALSNPRNISESDIRYPSRRWKNTYVGLRTKNHMFLMRPW